MKLNDLLNETLKSERAAEERAKNRKEKTETTSGKSIKTTASERAEQAKIHKEAKTQKKEERENLGSGPKEGPAKSSAHTWGAPTDTMKHYVQKKQEEKASKAEEKTETKNEYNKFLRKKVLITKNTLPGRPELTVEGILTTIYPVQETLSIKTDNGIVKVALTSIKNIKEI